MGTSARIVYVPGLGLDRKSAAGLVDRVGGMTAEDVVLLPGMGRRAPVPSVDGLADELRAQIGTGPVVLVGHSQSCQIVVAAAQHDARVSAVVLLGPTTDPRLRAPARLAWRWLRTLVHEPLWQYPRIVAQWLRTGPRAMTALWHSASPDDIDRRLATLRVPVTIARGTRDALCPGDWARRLVRAAADGRLVELPGAAHMTVQTHPDAVAALVRAAVTVSEESPSASTPSADQP